MSGDFDDNVYSHHDGTFRIIAGLESYSKYL